MSNDIQIIESVLIERKLSKVGIITHFTTNSAKAEYDGKQALIVKKGCRVYLTKGINVPYKYWDFIGCFNQNEFDLSQEMRMWVSLKNKFGKQPSIDLLKPLSLY